jgi:uncharacterized protein (TIGR03086 family)
VVTADDAAVLRRALDQLAGLLDDVPPGALGKATPCQDWTVRDLVDHIVASPANFARMVRGQLIDWSAPTPSAGDDPPARFREHAEDLLGAWRDTDGGGGRVALDWLCAELAVHTWDLATSLGRSTADLDPEIAERGSGFLQVNLTQGNRDPAFGPERQAPDGADVYQRAAAFAGRSI